MFGLGRHYSREEIHDAIGGNTQACLVQRDGAVIAVCYVPSMNPQAPRVILVGRGPQKEAAAAILGSQAMHVPMFAKRRTGRWEYLGLFKGDSYVQANAQTSRYVEGSGRNDVAGVLFLTPTQS
jgi:hypothetical protein